MSTLRVACELVNLRDPGESVRFETLLIDAGTEITWVPTLQLVQAGSSVAKKDQAFVMANGQTLRARSATR